MPSQPSHLHPIAKAIIAVSLELVALSVASAPLVLQPGGSASYTFIPAPGTSGPPAGAACTVPNKVGTSWTAGGQTCTGGAQTATAGDSLASGSSFSVNDSITPTTGSQTFSCNNGTITETASSCTAAAPASCTVPNKVGTSWTAGGQTCTGDNQTATAGTSLASGSSFSVNDITASVTGTQTLSCNNGTLTETSSSCTAAPACPTSYASQTVTAGNSGTVWGSGPYTNDSHMGTAALHAGLLTSGQTGTINIASAGWQTSYTGTTRYGVTTSSYGGFCGVTISLGSPPPPTTCTVPNKIGSTWTQGAASCQGESQTASSGSSMANGQSFTVYDNTQYHTGSQTYLCSSGTVSMTSTNCTASTPPLNETFSWLAGNWGNGMKHFSIAWNGSNFPITLSFWGEVYWYDSATPSLRYGTKEGVYGGRTWYGSHSWIGGNGYGFVCMGTGTYGGYSVHGVFPYNGTNCDLKNSAAGYNSGWLFPPGNYGTGTLVLKTAYRAQYQYTGTGVASPNPSLSTTSVPISGSWTSTAGTSGSYNGTLNQPSSGTVNYTDAGGNLVMGGSVTKGW